ELMTAFPAVLPGGFAVVDQARVIAPSCCCGLEAWNEWLDVLQTGCSPWMGHDPAPLVEVLDDRVNVWSDGGLGNRPDEDPIVFTRHEFAEAVRERATDLAKFEEPFLSWLGAHAAGYGKGLANQFRTSFISGKNRR